MFERFNQYTADELEACGAAFVGALTDAASSISWGETEAWTEFVLDWFSAAAPQGVLVDARSPRACTRTSPQRCTSGEFLVDLTHSTYPQYPPIGKYPYWRSEYWDAALQARCCVRLALESEWGRVGAPSQTRVAVLQDAIKVAAIRANVKVIVFGPHDTAHGEKVFADLEMLREQAEDSAPWLCVSLPWSDEAPTFRVFRT